MIFHIIWIHLSNNWHKYGVIFLLFREFRIVFHLIEWARDTRDNMQWIWQQLMRVVRKCWRWLAKYL